MNFNLIKTFIWFSLTLIILFWTTQPIYGAGKKMLLLSEQEVLKMVLSSSPFIKKIQFTKQKKLSQLLEKKHSFSTWGVFSKFSHSQRKNPQIFVFESRENKTRNFSIGFEKKIPYGLSLQSAYSDFFEDKTNSEFLKLAEAPEQIYRRNLNIELNADLTSGLTQYWILETIKQGETANDWLYYEMAEELALKAAGQYWKTYLAWEAYSQSKEGLKVYRRLVRQINSKKRYGFLKPGERPQILAEYENIKQSVDKEKQNYENEKKALFLFLEKDSDLYDIQFKEVRSAPPPQFSKINIENTRMMKIKEQQITEQEFKLKSRRVELFPHLQLSGKGGVIPGASSPGNLSFSSKQSFYEFGLGVKWIIFSKSFYERVNQEKYKLEEDKIDFNILKQELKNKLAGLEKEVEISYNNVNRTRKSNSYQKKAFRELQKSFEQGRVDIFELIHTERKLRESEIRKKAALSEYALLNLQFLAFRDKLVEDYLKP